MACVVSWMRVRMKEHVSNLLCLLQVLYTRVAMRFVNPKYEWWWAAYRKQCLLTKGPGANLKVMDSDNITGPDLSTYSNSVDNIISFAWPRDYHCITVGPDLKTQASQGQTSYWNFLQCRKESRLAQTAMCSKFLNESVIPSLAICSPVP